MESNKMIYFASPFFNEEQVEREERLKKKLRSLGFQVWSPKEASVCKADADEATRQKTFDGNLEAIKQCDIIFAVTDGKDMGTIFEAGFAYGLRFMRELAGVTDKKPLSVYYCETLGKNKFNLMLSQSGDLVFTKYEDLDKLPEMIQRINNGETFSYSGTIE